MTLPVPTLSAPDYLVGLNPPQLQAATTLDGAVLVLAGAGTGKTRVLTTRLAHLLKTGRAWPSQILAVTFTNKAAQEMKARVAALTGNPVEGWWLGTFHALAARMLRTHAEKVGLTSSFTIIDPDDQERLLKQIMEAEGVDIKKWAPRTVANVIDRWKDSAKLPTNVTQDDCKKAIYATSMADGKLVELYRIYQSRLRTVNACDFGDLLLHMITLMKDPRYPEVLAEYHRKFKYILVDEYQDTNTAQYLWLRLLAQGHGNICCVGDDDQSIYGWRGAEVTNILRFEKDFPNATVIRLEQNYRSTGNILAAAAGVIAHNNGRLGKTLWSAGEAGEKVKIAGVWDGESEARLIAEEIEALRTKGQKYSGIAILVRAGFQMREFEDRFLQTGLPYRVIGGPRFYERAEIRDAMAYFRVVAQPNDDLAFERIINLPKRGLGDTTVQVLHTHARARGISLYAAVADMLATNALKPKPAAALFNLLRDFDRWRGQLGEDNHAELAGIILDESGYTAMWQADKSPDAPGRLDNLKELVTTMADYPSLPAFLEHVALVMENTEKSEGDAISLMTLHGAKGLEFDTVFLPGWEDGIFPSQRTMDENGQQGVEEERRLAYVGLTRAKKRAMVTFAANRRQYGNWVQNLPSRFVGEIPEDHAEMAGATGMMGSPAPVRMVRYEESGFEVGDRVRHQDFGAGTVVHSDGRKLDILFDDGAQRRIMAAFVERI